MLTEPKVPRRGLPRLALRREDVASVLGVSAPTVDRLNAAGELPKPIRLRGTLVWNRRELAAYLDHGAPPRAVWQPIWRALVNRPRR